MFKLGVLYICIGKYNVFWRDFHLSAIKHLKSHNGDLRVNFYVFTDKPNEITPADNVHTIYVRDKGWPSNTLDRFEFFVNAATVLSENDFLIFFNANLVIVQDIWLDKLLTRSTSMLAVEHPGYYKLPRIFYPLERNRKSRAYVPYFNQCKYFQGALIGGKTLDFLAICKKMMEDIQSDKKIGIVARFHDESHWNKSLIGHSNITVLDPGFVYPEGWNLPFTPMILSRDKSKFFDQSFKSSSPNIVRKIISLLKK